MNTVLPGLLVLFRNSKRSLMYGSIASITAGLEELFESVVFSCPCHGHLAYGLAFLWAPTILLFFPGILLHRNLWRYPRKIDENKTRTRRCLAVFMITFDVFLQASIAPIAWLVLSLLKQQYYTCAFFGPSLESKALTNFSNNCFLKLGRRSKELEEIYRTRSQIAGWTLMLAALFILFTSICISRCTSKRKRMELPSLEYYRHVEAKEALEQFHAKAKELAKQNAAKSIKDFFQGANNKDIEGRIEEVSKIVLGKYGMFFVIPPESPSYDTPQPQVITRLQPLELSSELDGGEVRREEYHEQNRLEYEDDSKPQQLPCETSDRTHGQVAKVTLCRQVSIIQYESEKSRTSHAVV